MRGERWRRRVPLLVLLAPLVLLAGSLLLLLALQHPRAAEAAAGAAAPAGRAGGSVSAGSSAALRPYEHLRGELLDLDGPPRRYLLGGLAASTGYEVRVSFPASIPASIKFELVDSAAVLPPASLGTRAGRRLLDCEKLVFKTDAQGTVQGFAEPAVLLSAKRRSVHRDGPTAGAPKLVYNIVLAELLGNGLPKDSLPTVAAVVGAAVGALAWSLYWSLRLHPRLLLWLTRPPLAPPSSPPPPPHGQTPWAQGSASARSPPRKLPRGQQQHEQ